MPVATVDENGTQLFYYDTGPPSDVPDYTTLVLVHGTIYYSQIFIPMFPYAHKYGLRLIAINQRDYPGSTPYTDEEIADLHGDDVESQARMIRDRGIELSEFLLWLIKEGMVNKKVETPTGTAGGMTFLAWSSGNIMGFTFFAHLDELSKESQDLLGQYLRGVVIYDPAPYASGPVMPPLEKMYTPLRDPAVPFEAKGEVFATWVSAYYAHDPAMLDSFIDMSLDDWLASCAQHPIHDPPPHQRPTLKTMTPEELAGCTDVGGATRSHLAVVNVDRTIYEANCRRALTNTDVLPDLCVELVWTDMSPGDVMLGSWNIMRIAKEAGKTRKINVRRMRGANHFPHWDQPEESTKFLASIA
ncbi:hypothetical protein CERSUDRAFT_119069 [Gelatoporia subvermispora B]|uniref:AB hydrolase-1 domain-containing protein n=1 Tax=Ceriporiopsis subvermispora (strain B) TaxID=914234 RepID=M2R1F9_CERS8|nr:hypothetical protein CERSUDRAFT_119069 [Gelatoporia subvermispora B]